MHRDTHENCRARARLLRYSSLTLALLAACVSAPAWAGWECDMDGLEGIYAPQAPGGRRIRLWRRCRMHPATIRVALGMDSHGYGAASVAVRFNSTAWDYDYRR